MLIRLILDPADEHQSRANQMRQWFSFQEHFRRGNATGKEIVLNVIHAGEVFGEIAVIDGKERSAGASAMTDCDLLIIDRRDVLPIFERHPEICMMLMQVLCQRLRRTSEQVEDVLFRSLEARVAKALLQLMEDAKHVEPRAPEVVLHLSQNDLAVIAGGRRESVNKLLQAW